MIARVESVVRGVPGSGYAFRGLGDCQFDPDTNQTVCTDPVTTGSGTATDWQNITGCVGPDATGFDCGSCGAGYKLNDATGGCDVVPPTGGASPGSYCPPNYTYNNAGSCVPNSGSTGLTTIPGQQCPVGYTQQGNQCVQNAALPAGVLPTNTGNTLTNFLNSLANNTPTIVKAITGQTVTPAQCAAAGGTVNAQTGACTPATSSYLPILLVVAAVGVVVMMSGKGGR